MKRQLICSVVLIVCYINNLCGQNEDYLTKVNKAEVQKIIETLKSDNKASQNFSKSLEKSIANYCSYHYYVPKLADELFNLILKENRLPKNEYYRFLLLNAEYFSDLQLEFVKLDLARVLDKSDYQFYDIVSIYHLNVYKAMIASEVDTAYFSKLRDDFIHNDVAVGFLEKARPIIAMANLGESSLEDSIINIVGEFYSRCLSVEDTLAKQEHYVDLYFGVIPKILGKLNSKRSLDQTLYLMLDNFVSSLDGNRTSVYELYIDSVLFSKISRPDQRGLQNRRSEIRRGKLTQKDFVDKLFLQVRNSGLNWKKTLLDANE